MKNLDGNMQVLYEDIRVLINTSLSPMKVLKKGPFRGWNCTAIEGQKYRLEVLLQNRGFAIRAICKSSRRYSCVNNLNTMLSELGVNPEDPKFEDSWWELPTVEEAKELADHAKVLVSDRQFLSYLEGKLDEDRSYGEWENIERTFYLQSKKRKRDKNQDRYQQAGRSKNKRFRD